MSDTTKFYEGLFLVSQNMIATDPSAVEAEIKTILTRAEADISLLRLWGEQKLAYDIAGQKRGTFYIAYFHCCPTKLEGIERECNLSDIVLRKMIIKADHIGEEELAAEVAKG